MSCSIGLQLARRSLSAGASRSSSALMQAPGWAAQAQQRQLQYHGAERQGAYMRPMSEVAGLQPADSSGHDQHKPTFVKALLLDVAGTLLSPSEPVTDVYRRYGAEFDLKVSDQDMLRRFRAAYNRPWTKSSLRYVGDAKDFWGYMVAETTGCSRPELLDDVYDYYARGEAWTLAPGSLACLKALRAMGVKLAIVSNFDTRLRPLLEDMEVAQLFDEIIVSAEVMAEKPNPVIFTRAVEALNVEPHECLHVGDDRRNDLWGARDAGCHALLWGSDVNDMAEVVHWVAHGSFPDDDDHL